MRPETGAVAGALSTVGSDAARAAVHAARAYVLEHNTLAAFERRWEAFLTGIRMLP